MADSPDGGFGGSTDTGQDGQTGSNASDSGGNSTAGTSDPDGTSSPSGFPGMNSVVGSDPAADKGPDAPGASAPSGNSQLEGPETLQQQLEQIGLGWKELTDNVFDFGVKTLTAPIPLSGVLDLFTTVARALGLDEEPAGPPPVDQAGEGPGPMPAAPGSPYASGPTVTVNPPTFDFLPSGAPQAAAGPYAPSLEQIVSGAPATNQAAQAAPAEQGGVDLAAVGLAAAVLLAAAEL